MSTTNPPLPEFDIDPRAFRHLADAQVGVELDTGDMILNLGPQHPATHGTLRIVVRLDGERVIAADPVIGYMHRGYEKLTEFRTYPQITTLINRIDWLSSFANEVPFIAGADWHERECWEMFGVIFDGHPALRHLYLPSEFEGHPLRKDFALLSRVVKPWPGLVDVEPMPEEAAADETVGEAAEAAAESGVES